MSTIEYYDLFLKTEKNGIYHMFVFDIVNSKKMDNKTRENAQIKMQELMNCIYNSIKEIELNNNKKILLKNEIVPYNEKDKVKLKFGFLYEPFLFADTFGFTVYRETITKEEILFLYEKFKKILEIDFEFHIKDGYYETNKYEEGNKLLFRGYLIDILSNCHKNYFQKLIKKK